MKTIKNLLAASIAASVMATPVMAEEASSGVEVSASVGIASTYLWRGFDLGSGTPAVSGDLSVSSGGAYGTIWVSSGDETAGTEYDLIVGYGGEAGEFNYDVSLVNYIYPTGAGYLPNSDTDFGDHTDLVVSVGYGPVNFTMYDNVAGFSGAAYYTLSAEFGQFSALIGMHNEDANADGDVLIDDEPVHLDLSYAYNDNLSFTFSQFISDEDNVDDDLQFVVGYNIPLK